VLPRGVTLRGSYAASEYASSVNQTVRVGVSFGVTLASKPTPHFVGEGETPPAQCPGSVADGQAQAGSLCVYELKAVNTSAVEILDPTTVKEGASQLGWYVHANSAAGAEALSYGT
jgi:hypothetical protein